MQIRDAMTRDVVAVPPTATLKSATALFLAHGVSGLPVVEGGRLVGILSESDIVAKETSGFDNGEVSAEEELRLARERDATLVADAMTRDPVTAAPWMSIWAAADVMTINGVNRLPVLDADGRLVGIVTRQDLVRAFARSDEAIERDIREHLLPSVGLGANALDVSVQDGAVTVAGELDSEMALECMRATLRLVPGVVRVVWNVEVPHPGV